MSVRTYNPSVRVGNWNEDIQLEEDNLKDFLARRERGELLIQQSAMMKDSALQQCSLSVSRDGFVHFGDSAMIVNPSPACGSRGPACLSLNSNGLSVASDIKPSSRNCFMFTSLEAPDSNKTLCYGVPFYIVAGGGFLSSDRATFGKCAKKSRHNEVTLASSPGHLTEWKIIPFNPAFRMELEGDPVPANQKIILVHVKTNTNLCNEADFVLKTPFGKEYEVSTFTKLDSHRAEEDYNHWVVSMQAPGDSSMGNIGPDATS